MAGYFVDTTKLPDQFRDLVEGELRDGETILWLSQPIPNRFAMK
ncbi:MAG: hypothetical protein ACE5LU_23870 [Anaerolineae bacterium]